MWRLSVDMIRGSDYYIDALSGKYSGGCSLFQFLGLALLIDFEIYPEIYQGLN